MGQSVLLICYTILKCHMYTERVIGRCNRSSCLHWQSINPPYDETAVYELEEKIHKVVLKKSFLLSSWIKVTLEKTVIKHIVQKFCEFCEANMSLQANHVGIFVLAAMLWVYLFCRCNPNKPRCHYQDVSLHHGSTRKHYLRKRCQQESLPHTFMQRDHACAIFGI